MLQRSISAVGYLFELVLYTIDQTITRNHQRPCLFLFYRSFACFLSIQSDLRSHVSFNDCDQVI